MSVQAGIWNFDGQSAQTDLLDQLSDSIAQYGPDGTERLCMGSVGMLYRPFHTTLESRLERQPYVSSRGYVITWDGRLDNREDLIPEVHNDLTADQTDVAIVATAFEKWGSGCLHKFIGDWALTVWDAVENTLILARDYSGIRKLYYYKTPAKLLWCTHLAPIVLLSGTQFTLNDEYIAGYLVEAPEAHLTPYKGICGVPPGKSVQICSGKIVVHSQWVFEPRRNIRYKTDAEYQEHFRYVFRKAVRRRLRSDSPILGELSGGYDSTAIVCMADDILACEGPQCSRMDTISFYDLSEPDGDDFSYFTKVERARGRMGFRINLQQFRPILTLKCPDFLSSPNLEFTEELKLAKRKVFQEGGYRVVLSGFAGDELNGQATEFRLLIGDLMARFRLFELAKQLKAWSLLTKRPWTQLFFQSAAQLLPLSLRERMLKTARFGPWIDREFARKYRLSRRKLGEVEVTRFWLPSLRDSATTIAWLTRYLANDRPSEIEKRYPYLDRDFVEFVTAIPPDQLLRPGERRSLMRRSLAGILPSEVLARQTKGGGDRSYILMVQEHWEMIEGIVNSPLSGRLGYIEPSRFRDALWDLKNGKAAANFLELFRVLALEIWLRDVTRRGALSSAPRKLVTT
jgi:asparagine synthase (glutamine-hydrolysing)